MAAQYRNNFQRSQSKVWWGNNYLEKQHTFDYSSLDHEIVAVAQPQTPAQQISPDQQSTSWLNRQGSPSSHKSQDSGFSDNDISSNFTRTLSGYSRTSSTSSPDKNLNKCNESLDKTPKKTISHRLNEIINQRSPSICSSGAPTPPTVIRKPQQPGVLIGMPLIVSSKRLSFSAPSSPIPANDSILSQIDSFSYQNTSPVQTSRALAADNVAVPQTPPTTNECDQVHDADSPRSSCRCTKDRSIRRSRVITKNSNVNRSLIGYFRQMSEPLKDSEQAEDETLVRCIASASLKLPKSILKNSTKDDNNNATQQSQKLPTYSDLFPTGTSTPILGSPVQSPYQSLPISPKRVINDGVKVHSYGNTMFTNLSSSSYEDTSSVTFYPPIFKDYENPLLNGHAPAVQFWLDDLQHVICNEVLTTLQTKSVSVEAARSLKLTSTTAVKTIKTLQASVMVLQQEFEKVEKLFASADGDEDEEDDLNLSQYGQLAPLLQSLAGNVSNFLEKQKSKNVFCADNVKEAETFVNNIDHILEMTNDLRQAATKIDDFDVLSIAEDVQILKRYFLITIRTIFEKLIKIIVNGIEDAKCEMMLRSNLSYVSMLSNIEYTGFASLSDAFLANGTVRVILIICLDSRHSSIRALALRALATVCSTREAIKQLEMADGMEILKEIMQDTDPSVRRLEPELRETVSLLTQMTGPWHGNEHHVEGLRNCVDALVESISDLLSTTKCCQTLLLCAACLNNFSRLESTSIYSLMGHQSILKLKNACYARGPDVSPFLYEQVTTMLFNMSINKKSHHHLADKNVVEFLTHIFQTALCRSKYFNGNTAEMEATNKTIKNVLHIFSHLIHESSIAEDILENNVLPIFARMEHNLDGSSEHWRDVSFISRKLNESLSMRMVEQHQVESKKVQVTQAEHPLGHRLVQVDESRQETFV